MRNCKSFISMEFFSSTDEKIVNTLKGFYKVSKNFPLSSPQTPKVAVNHLGKSPVPAQNHKFVSAKEAENLAK